MGIDETRFRLNRSNPMRPPDWRFQWVRTCLDRGYKLPTRRDDKPTYEIYRFMRLLAICGKDEGQQIRLAREKPGLWCAFDVQHGRATSLRPIVEARLLASEADTEVGKKTGLDPQVVHWFERAFYDVRSRLRQRDFVFTYLVAMPGTTGVAARDDHALWKLVGYLCGPQALDRLVHPGGLAGALRDTAEVTQWLAGQTTDVLQRKALQAAHRLNPLEQKDLLATLRIAAHAERAKTAASGTPPNRWEVHVHEMLDEILWMVGDRGKTAAGSPWRPVNRCEARNAIARIVYLDLSDKHLRKPE